VPAATVPMQIQRQENQIHWITCSVNPSWVKRMCGTRLLLISSCLVVVIRVVDSDYKLKCGQYRRVMGKLRHDMVYDR